MMTFLNGFHGIKFTLLKGGIGLAFFLFMGVGATGHVYAEGAGQSIKDVLNNSGISITDKKAPKYLPTAKSESPKAALADTIQAFTNVISGFAAGIAILFIVINAGKLIMAVGSSDEITKAKKNIVWAGVGLLLVMFAFVLAKTIISITFSGDF